MIKKRNMVNANVSFEPTSTTSSDSNICTNIYIARKVPYEKGWEMSISHVFLLMIKIDA